MEKAAERQVGNSRNQVSGRLAGRANRIAQGGLVHVGLTLGFLQRSTEYSVTFSRRLTVDPQNSPT